MSTPDYHTNAGIVESIGRFTVKHKDFFNMKTLYHVLHEWLIKEDYASRYDPEFNEVLMLEKINQQTGKEIWIHWRPEKKPMEADGNASEFFRYVISLDYHIVLLKNTEVMHEGVKYKTDWGEVELIFKAFLVVDPEGKWKKHWFLKNILQLFVKRIMKHNFEMHRRTLFRDLFTLQNEAKEYLKLRSFMPEPGTQFWNPLGLGPVK